MQGWQQNTISPLHPRLSSLTLYLSLGEAFSLTMFYSSLTPNCVSFGGGIASSSFWSLSLLLFLKTFKR